MKEYNRVDFEDADYNDLDHEQFNEISGFNQNKIISPLVSNQNSPIKNNNIEPKEEENNSYKYVNNFSKPSKISYNDDNINEKYQFMRYPLKDEEKKYLTPSNKTFFFKILDLLINW